MVPKFRVWDDARDEYFEVRSLSFPVSNNDKLGIVATAGDQTAYGPKIILEQFTGLKDTNGKEIYEGDIVHFKSEMLSGLGIVKWDEKVGAWEVDDIRPRTKKRGHRIYPFYPEAVYRVEGNIHENPELLEVQHDN